MQFGKSGIAVCVKGLNLMKRLILAGAVYTIGVLPAYAQATSCNLPNGWTINDANNYLTAAQTKLDLGIRAGGCFSRVPPCDSAYNDFYQADSIVTALIEYAVGNACRRCDLNDLVPLAMRLQAVSIQFNDAGIYISDARRDYVWILNSHQSKQLCANPNELMRVWSGRLTRSDGAGFEFYVEFFLNPDNTLGAKVGFSAGSEIIATFVERLGNQVRIQFPHRCGYSTLDITLSGNRPDSGFSQTSGSSPDCLRTADWDFY